MGWVERDTSGKVVRTDLWASSFGEDVARSLRALQNPRVTTRAGIAKGGNGAVVGHQMMEFGIRYMVDSARSRTRATLI